MDKEKNKQPILLSAGGTGGHVFPARALAEDLLGKGYKVVLATDSRGLKYFNGLDGQVERIIISSGAYQSGLTGKIVGVVALLKGYVQSHALISRLKPAAVVGFGGYPSAPPVFAAQHRGIPTILHEQNAILGMANALLAPLAKRIALSAAKTKGLKPAWAKKASLTGNPIRGEIAKLFSVSYPDTKQGKIRLMVVGGSQGAKAFADVIPYAITSLPVEIRQNLFVYHQARPDDLEKVKAAYTGSGIETDIRTFFDNMPECIEKAHLLITRSGASTVAELTAAGRPAIYIPFPWNRDYQQLYNAAEVEEAGGGVVLEEKNLTKEALNAKIAELLTTPEILEKMAGNAKKLGITDAASRLSELVLAEID